MYQMYSTPVSAPSSWPSSPSLGPIPPLCRRRVLPRSISTPSLRSFSPFGRKRPVPQSPPPLPVQNSLESKPEPSSLSGDSKVTSNHDRSSSNSQSLLKAGPAFTTKLLQEISSPKARSKRRKLSADEQNARDHTKKRVAVAAKAILGTTVDVTHELLYIGCDFLGFAPIPGLAPTAIALLQIWDALGCVDVNAMSCVRLTERCAETLIAVREEIHQAGDLVTEELHLPLERLQEAFDRVRLLMIKEANRPFMKRYLRRADAMKDIADCDTDVREALDVFNVSVSIRILRQSKESELQRQAETRELLAAILDRRSPQDSVDALMITGVSGLIPPQSSPQPAVAPPPAYSDNMSAEQVRSSITQLQSVQDVADRTQDGENFVCLSSRLGKEQTTQKCSKCSKCLQTSTNRHRTL